MAKTNGAALTYDRLGQRWVKVYRGRKFYGQRGVRKSDRNAYAVAGPNSMSGG